MDLIFSPRTLLNNTGPEVNYTMIVYGSTPGDPVNDDRYGMHQRRVEIVVRPRLPRDHMTIPEINEFCRLFMAYQWQDVKHTNFWHCEFCGAFAVW